jgi:hypothetical protein
MFFKSNKSIKKNTITDLNKIFKKELGEKSNAFKASFSDNKFILKQLNETTVKISKKINNFN